MLHIIHQRRWNFDASSTGKALRDLRVDYKVFSRFLDLRAKSRIGLLLHVYPRLIFNSICLGFASLLMTSNPPKALIVWTEIEALIIGLIRSILRRRAKIALQTIIITPRSSPLLRHLHHAYWRAILSVIDVGTCHGRSEMQSYQKMFPQFAHKFFYVPFGLDVDESVIERRESEVDIPVIVAAGRSGRDYLTLVKAAEGLRCKVVIICDMLEPVSKLLSSPQLEIRSNCFDADYLGMIAASSVVVIPLAVDDISAGQMVFLQAAALAKPIIMTRTSTTLDYATDQENAWLVARGDVKAMHEAIRTMLSDHILASRLATMAKARFEAHHSTLSLMRTTMEAIQSA